MATPYRRKTLLLAATAGSLCSSFLLGNSLTPTHSPTRLHVEPLNGAVAVATDMGPQVQALPMLSFTFVTLSFAWLRTRVEQYNSAAERFEEATAQLRRAKVDLLTSGEPGLADQVSTASRNLDEARAAMEDARTIRGPLGFVASIRVGGRAKPQVDYDREPSAASSLVSSLLRTTLLASTIVVLVPLFALTMADPMLPPMQRMLQDEAFMSEFLLSSSLSEERLPQSRYLIDLDSSL